MKIITTEITDISLFLSGAFVTRRAEAEGTAVALLPRNIDKLTVTAEGGKIKSVSARPDESALITTAETARAEERLRELDAAIVKAQNAIELADVERAIYAENYQTGRDCMKETVDYFTKAVKKTLKNRAELTAELSALNKKRGAIAARLERMRGATEVRVELTDKAKLTFTYYAPDCGFSHRYKIHYAAGRISCDYVAELWQNTGEDWDAPVTLAAAHPRMSAQLPDFAPEYIFGEAPRASARTMMMRAAPNACEVSYCDAGYETDAEESEDVATVYRVHAEVVSGAKLSLPLKSFGAEATTGRTALPYLDPTVYLTAETDAAPFGVCSDADVFVDGRMAGASKLTRRGGKVLIPLGAEQNIYVIYTQPHGRTERLSDSESRVTVTSSVEVTNAKSEVAALTLADRIPLSGHNLVKIEPTELSGGALDPATGRVDWTLSLRPGESKKLTLKYSYTKPDNVR